MSRPLLDPLAGRWTFVVGKGGVGKTTTAGAIALALADSGASTHLLSTDPAHSLGDLFGADLSDGHAHASPCTDDLTLEELDAEGRSASWRRDAASPLGELIERGTYLDGEDVRSLLSLSFPGADELMAALRLAELDGTSIQRIVVDTAPTGHTLRMLDAEAVLRGWIEAFRAMADKAVAVESSMTHADVRLSGEDFLDGLEGRLDTLRDRVLRSAAFVVVTAPGPVVEAETGRLVGELERRGLSVALRVAVGQASAGVLALPELEDATGCEGLRRVAAGAGTAAGGGEGEGERTGTRTGRGGGTDASCNELLDRLGRRELLLVAGKGGVGKSTCAAAVALGLAEGRSVSLFSTDPAGSLADVLGLELAAEGSRVGERLFVRQLDAEASYEALRSRYRDEIDAAFEGFGLGGSAELDRRVVQSLWSLAPPGIDEVFALGAVLDAAGQQEVLVIDSAPTGHFLRLVAMPQLALDWTHALMRVLLRTGAAGRLDSPAERLLGFAKQLKSLRALLTDSQRAAAVVVTLDSRLVEAETRRLTEALERAGIDVAALVRNRAGAGPGGGGSQAAPPAGGALVRAPLQPSPPIGSAALLSFLSRWECSA